MLSQENINKLCFTGIYTADPDDFFTTPSVASENSFRNWIFRVEHNGADYLMVDTFWRLNSQSFTLTDENFDRFRLLFDLNEVERYYGGYFSDFDPADKWLVKEEPGDLYPQKYVRKGAKPVPELVIHRLKIEIEELKTKLDYKKNLLARIVSGEDDLSWIS